MQAITSLLSSPEAELQLLLFIDRRTSSVQQSQMVVDYLDPFKVSYNFDLKVIEMSEHPYLVEHFKLVASPALIKILPEPRHILAGSNLIDQLRRYWPEWLESLPSQSEDAPELIIERSSFEPQAALTPSMAYSAELLRLSDEIFRLRQENAELQEQTLFKDQVISMLAHDLRNPLTAAAIALETLELGLTPKVEESGRRPLTPELINQLLNHARTQTRAIDRMITDILQNAREKNFQYNLKPQELDLSLLGLDVLEHLRKQFLSKHQTLETDIPNDLPPIFADCEQIRQVLVNLLDNASKYTPEGGKIQIAMLHRTSQKVQVSICDTGPGIPEDSQERIFEDHVRLQNEQSGYGIGLSVCQRIIRAHYGQIWVTSMLGQGSCFYFTLPVFRR
jgi:two-component system, OmpR family, clock-associated histidine kinase SasA